MQRCLMHTDADGQSRLPHFLEFYKGRVHRDQHPIAFLCTLCIDSHRDSHLTGDSAYPCACLAMGRASASLPAVESWRSEPPSTKGVQAPWSWLLLQAPTPPATHACKGCYFIVQESHSSRQHPNRCHMCHTGGCVGGWCSDLTAT